MYRLLLPFARLPLWFHHCIATLICPVVHYVVRYRLAVVRQNLDRCFPEKTLKEKRRIERLYYRHMCDLLAEGFHNIAAPLRTIRRHYKLENPDILEPYYDAGRSVVLMSAHFNNWEYMITSLDSHLHHHGIGVGKPLSNKKFGVFITARRDRFGTEIVDQTDVRQVMQFYHQHNVPVAYMMLSDQSPGNPKRCFWTTFLHQDTPFIFGAEHFARKYDMPVFFYDVRRLRRGFYSVVFQLVTDSPNSLPEGSITTLYAKHLEQQIEQNPPYWLWSHRRWKHHRDN